MITTLQSILRRAGVSPTPQRVAVFGALRGRRVHPSVDEVYSQLKAELPTLSKTTVYTTMQMLAEKRLIGVVHVDGDELRYDGYTDFHAHFHCRACGKVFDVNLDGPHYGPFVKLPRGFSCSSEELTYYGLCPDCKTKGKAK